MFCFLPTRFIAKAREKTKEQVPVVPPSNRAKRNCHKEWNPETETWNYAVTQKSASHTDTTDVIEELKQTVTPSGKEKKKETTAVFVYVEQFIFFEIPTRTYQKAAEENQEGPQHAQTGGDRDHEES